MSTKRALHFVFKVSQRTETIKFYRDVLGMKILRHEEFEEGCKASCNGPYDGKWSKSMVGYGPEDSHFVVELTYNYGVGSYKLGTDFRGLTVHSKKVLLNAQAAGWPVSDTEGAKVLQAPGGYKFFIVEQDTDGDPVKRVSLSCADLKKSIDYWQGKCGMKLISQDDQTAVLAYGDNQCQLELVCIGDKVDHATAFGRVAFACPAAEAFGTTGDNKTMTDAGERVLTPLVSLDTPGKATVQVVILADPDGHEICFVGSEAFSELSQVDPNADKLLNQALADDKSEEWFAKKGKVKATAE